MPILCLAAALVTGYSAFTDLKCHKIYNKCTLPAIAAGLCANLFLNGANGLKNSLSGLLLGGLFMVTWFLGMLKAGDIKLYMAVGALMGWKFCGYTFLYSVLIGGIAAVCLTVIRRNGCKAFTRLKIYLTNLFYTKQFQMYQPEEEQAYFSFGCCIFAGTLAAFCRLTGKG